MTEITKYICDYCEEEFLDEDKCLEHEHGHIIEEIKDDLFFWDNEMKPLEVCCGNVDDAWYIHWTSERALEVLMDWYEERVGNRYAFNLWEADSEGYVYYNDARYNEGWENFTDLKARISKMDKKFMGK